MPKLPELPETSQKLMKGGLTLETVSVWGDYDEHEPLGGYVEHNTGPDDYYEDDGWGGGSSGSGSGSDSNSDHDHDHENNEVCTCADVLANDVMDGEINANTEDRVNAAAGAFGLATNVADLTLDSILAFADGVANDPNAKLLGKISNGLAMVGVVTSGTQLFMTVTDDGLTTDDWDEMVSFFISFGVAATVVAGATISAPVSLALAATGLVVSIASISGTLGTSADDHSISDEHLNDQGSLDTSCPIHG